MSATSVDDMAPGASMEWAPASTSKEQQQAKPAPRKRRRIVISCTECHRRKQKCDRKFPCTNCISRNKDSACRYETGAPTAKQHGRRAVTGMTAPPSDMAGKQELSQERTTATAAAATFGYSHTSANTLGFLHHIESTANAGSANPDEDDGDDGDDNDDDNNNDGDDDDDDDDDDGNRNNSNNNVNNGSGRRRSGNSRNNNENNAVDMTAIIGELHNPLATIRTATAASSLDMATTMTTTPNATSNTPALTPAERATRDRYKTLIRQLPARCAIEKLSALYFAEFNTHYAMLDRDVFDAQLAEWYRLPFSLLSSGPGPAALSREMRAFPAVVFQVCAVALLVLEDEADVPDSSGAGGRAAAHWFSGLKYAGGMTFEDLAREYSDCGVELLHVLGKRDMSLNTVIAGWLRASWLKYVGLVTESWHAVGSAVHDAQEIGLHRDSLDPKPASNDAEAVLENQWEVQRRRKAWMTLVQWDVHMASVLGRPTTIELRMTPPSLPVDAPEPKDRSRTPVLPRGENDPPTPVTRAIWSFHVVRPLREILELEKEGPCPKDFSKVDRLHNELLDIEARTPAFFRLENPDTRFDALPECAWLPMARVIFPQLISFELMALHRPYIFTRPKSRTEALKASLDMLHAQRLHFQSLRPQLYKTFSVFFGTFDAIVLMASIYILFPKEHPEMVPQAIQHFRWAVERFRAMSTRNALAKSALGVLHAICVRMTKALGLSKLAAKKMLQPGPAPDSTFQANGSTNCSSVASSTGFSPCAQTSHSSSPSTGGSGTTMSSAAVSTPGHDFSFPQQSDLSSNTPQNSANTTTNAAAATAPGPTATTTATTTMTATTTTTTTTPSNPTPATDFSNFNWDPDLFSVNPSSIDYNPFEWNPPSDFDWSSLQPIYATCDLLYHNLTRTVPGSAPAAGPDSGQAGLGWDFQSQQGAYDGGGGGGGGGGGIGLQGNGLDMTAGGSGGGMDMGTSTAAATTMTAGTLDGGGADVPYCRFEGDFGDDSVWNLLNQYCPY